MSDLSASDVALMNDRNNGFGDGGGWAWLIVILALMGGGFGGWGNRGPMMPSDTVTSAELQASQNAQTQSLSMQQLMQETANNRFEITQAINDQTRDYMNMNNTNQINVIQGFNAIQQQIANQTQTLASKQDALSAQLNQCCCSIKTQMLQDQLTETRAQLVTAQNNISNYNQTQTLLAQMGRFVPWAGTGSAAAAPTTVAG